MKSDLRQPPGSCCFDGSEVGNFDAPVVVQQQIRRIDVSVNDSFLAISGFVQKAEVVRVFLRREYLFEQIHGLLGSGNSLLVQQFA